MTATAQQVADAISTAARDADSDKPVLAVVMSARAAYPAHPLRSGSAVAGFRLSPESAARSPVARRSAPAWLRRPQGSIQALADVRRTVGAEVVERALARADDGWLSPAETRELLNAYGIPLVPERLAGKHGRRGRRGPRARLSGRRQIRSPGAHKTESGGVALDLGDDDAVRAAAERIGLPLIVQPMLLGGAGCWRASCRIGARPTRRLQAGRRLPRG